MQRFFYRLLGRTADDTDHDPLARPDPADGDRLGTTTAYRRTGAARDLLFDNGF